MMYLRWFMYWILSCVISLVCYITNPIVVLFCDENGELPGVLQLWQTWDDSCDSEYYMTECVPKIFNYGYYSKYYPQTLGTTPALAAVGRVRWFTQKRPNAKFSLKERIQRYFCRLLWLTRNCGYGFNFWLLGADVDGRSMSYKVNEPGREIGDNGKYFIIHSDALITNLGKLKVYWKVFLGWKISDQPGLHKAMFANRFLIRFSFD